MAITVVRERLGYEHDAELGDLTPLRTYTRHFWVYSDTKNESPIAVRQAAGLPQLGNVHPNDVGCIVKKVGARRDDEYPNRWDVVVSYNVSTFQVGTVPPTNVEDYEKIRVSTRQGERLFEIDRTGAAIVNSAGDLIENVVIPWNALTITIEQYRLLGPSHYATGMWINAINSVSWRGVPPFFAKIAGLDYDEAIIEGVSCWKRTATVELAHADAQPQGWKYRALDAGLRERLVGGEMQHIRDTKTGIFVSRPVRLNGAGLVLAAGEDPEYTDWQLRPELSFATLGI